MTRRLLPAVALLFAACGWLEDHKPGREGPQQPHCQDPGGAGPHPHATPTAFTGSTWGTPQQRDTVRGYMKKLMDETRVVPDTAARKGGPRGSAGSFAKLPEPVVEEFVTAIIHGAERFMPKSLTDEQRWALVCAEISIESAFTPGTSGVNPGDTSKRSVGPLQLTLPGMWDDIFREHAKIPGLTHYDGSPWDPKDTTTQMLEQSVFDGVTAALWCITEQGRRGVPDWFGGPDGPLPKTWHNAQLAWVIGGPALKSGGDLDGQRDFYLASERVDLQLLGFDVGLLDTSF